jgi:2-iminobutanoate/2-iminopropanoate deaminase
MSKRSIEPPIKKSVTGGYSSGVLVDGWLYVSGQGPLDLGTGKVVVGTLAEETHLTLKNVLAVIEAAGGSLDDIVKCCVHLNDIDDFADFDAAYRAFFGDRPLPARTTVGSTLYANIKVEIDAVAYLPQARTSQ